MKRILTAIFLPLICLFFTNVLVLADEKGEENREYYNKKEDESRKFYEDKEKEHREYREEQQRENSKHYEEQKREAYQHYEEQDREARKYRDEQEREARKHREEMQREERKRYEEQEREARKRYEEQQREERKKHHKKWKHDNERDDHVMHKRHTYRYFPSSDVYYDEEKKVYFYLEGDKWGVSVNLPDGFNLGQHEYVTIETDKDRPYDDYLEHLETYGKHQ
jgi:hypothetical protein